MRKSNGNRYSEEFKQGAVKLVLEDKQSPSRKNGHEKAILSGMNRRISLKCVTMPRYLPQAALLESLAAYTFGAIQPRAECGRTAL
jgi:hypothetical protein